MNLVDLHVHTTYSDGTFTPENVMKYAKEKNIKAIAITDHDAVSGLDIAEKWADEIGIEFVPGIEIAADYMGKEIHILGYYIDRHNEKLLKFLSDITVKRIERSKKVLKILNDDGINVTLDDLKSGDETIVISRPHFAKYMVDKGYYPSMYEAFKNYLGKGRKAYVDLEMPHYSEAIAVIKEAGGTPVLAHPVQYRIDYEKVDAMINDLTASGIEGIEAIYTNNKEGDEEAYRKIAEKYSLIVTGGSDFHGDIKPGLDLGSGYDNLAIDYGVLENLKNHRSSK